MRINVETDCSRTVAWQIFTIAIILSTCSSRTNWCPQIPLKWGNNLAFSFARPKRTVKKFWKIISCSFMETCINNSQYRIAVKMVTSRQTSLREHLKSSFLLLSLYCLLCCLYREFVCLGYITVHCYCTRFVQTFRRIYAYHYIFMSIIMRILANYFYEFHAARMQTKFCTSCLHHVRRPSGLFWRVNFI